jgi:hypothetical protein
MIAKARSPADIGERAYTHFPDLLGVNELQDGRCGSLVQLEGLHRPDEVDVGRPGCCTFLLYLRQPLTLNTATALASYRWLDLRERGSSRESRSGLQGP